MRKLAIIFCVLFIYSNTYCQDWSLFIHGQTSYYKQEFDLSIKVESFVFDSLYANNNGEVHYFNRESELSNECYDNLFYEAELIGWWLNPDKIDSLIVIGDSVLFVSDYYSVTDTFIFMPNSNVGDSWITNNVSIECISEEFNSFLGIQDSVKIFECNGSNLTGFNFILSKNYGLIKFIPFNNFLMPLGSSLSPSFELIGFKNESVSSGYIQPDFSDYFHLNVGDILYWRYNSNSWDPPGFIVSYNIDTMIYVYHFEDSVHYQFVRTRISSDGEIENSTIMNTYHLRSEEGKILENSTSWFGLLNSPGLDGEAFLFNSLTMEIENGDTITFAEFETPGLYIDTITCEVGMILDWDMTKRYSTRDGLIFRGTFSWGEDSNTLIGSIINGVSNGETALPIGMEYYEYNQLSVYPNPTKDLIHIDSELNNYETLEILDSSGKVLLNIPYQENLDLSSLPSGLYILVIKGENKLTRRIKIMKD